MPITTDWLMVIITAVYVIVTILICIFNAKSTKAAYKQVEEIKEQYAEDNKPVLAVYPFMKDKQLCFEIKNIGSRKALEVNVDFPKDNILTDLKKNWDRFDLKLKNKDIELMPQQSVYYVLEHLSIPQSALETLKHLGAIYLQVSFKDEKGINYHSKQIADTSALAFHYTIEKA